MLPLLYSGASTLGSVLAALPVAGVPLLDASNIQLLHFPLTTLPSSTICYCDSETNPHGFSRRMDDKMKTKKSFSFSRPPPLADRSDLQLRDDHVSGPSRLFNPTRARFQHLPQRSDTTGGDHESSELTAPKPKPKAQFQWRSRDNRKGKQHLPDHLDSHTDKIF